MTKKEQKRPPTNIHDEFFLTTFSNLDNARDFLLSELPKDLADAIDFTKMDIEPSAHQEKSGRKIYSDFIVKTQLKKDSYPADIYILFEHKTKQSSDIFVQLFSYMTAMWREDLAKTGKKRGKTRYRLIIPVVFYHGEIKWNIATNFAKLFDVDSVFDTHLPDFSYELFDTNRWNLDEAQKEKVSENIELFSSMVALTGMYKKNSEVLKLSIEIVLAAMLPNSQKERLVGMLVGYVAEGKNLDEKEIKDLIEERVSEREGIMPNAVETWIQRGYEKGVDQGVQKGMQQERIVVAKQMLLEGAGVEFVSRVTKLSIKEIQQIKKLLH